MLIEAGALNTFVPADRVAHGQQHSDIGIGVQEFFIEGAPGPVYGRLISIKELVPVDGLSSGGGFPLCGVLRVVEHFDHMVTGAEARFFEGAFQG